MTREELFQAIGQVESDRLLRSELTVQSPSETHTEEPNMNKKTRRLGRTLRNLLVAAIILSTLAVTAYAVGGYLIYESPEQMLTAIFGDQTGYDHKNVTTVTSPWDPSAQWEEPGYDRVPADETVVAEEIAPYVSPVGQVIRRSGYTLTVDAFLYDSATACGLVTYTLESENGLPEYQLQNNGELWYSGGADPVSFNQYGYPYIIQEKTTQDQLAVTYYFQFNEHWDKEFTVALGDYAMTDEEINELLTKCRAEVRKNYTPEEAVAEAKKNLGEELFNRSANPYGDVDTAYETLSNSMFEQKIAQRKDRWVMTEEAVEELFSQCDKEVRERYSKEEALAQADVEYAYTYLSSELYQKTADQREKIVFDCSRSSQLTNVTLADGAVTISPISMVFDVSKMEFLHRKLEDGSTYIDSGNVDEFVIHFSDGTSYTVMDDKTDNTLFWVAGGPTKETASNTAFGTIMFNRIIDVDKITSITVNGTKLPKT